MISPYETIDCGPSNRSAIKRFANKCQDLVNSGQPIPPGAFSKYIAERIVGPDKQDFTLLLSGKKGMGKSWSSLYLCHRVAEEVAKIKGGAPEDYFSLRNCCLLEDTEAITNLLQRTEKYQCILIDDSSVALGSRDWMTKKSKDFNRIFATCRTNRWFLILNAPVRTHVDLQIREMVDVVGTIYKSFHKGGFNLMKLTSVELSESRQNKQYSRRLSFGGQKIDFFATFKPPQAMADEYDRLRELAGRNIITNQLEASRSEGKPKVTKAEKNLKLASDKFLPVIKSEMLLDTSVSCAKLANITGQNRATIRRICQYEGIVLGGKKE